MLSTSVCTVTVKGIGLCDGACVAIEGLGIYAGAGVKNLLAGEQQAAVTVAVEALMDNKPEAEANFATLDPKVTVAA